MNHDFANEKFIQTECSSTTVVTNRVIEQVWGIGSGNIGWVVKPLSEKNLPHCYSRNFWECEIYIYKNNRVDTIDTKILLLIPQMDFFSNPCYGANRRVYIVSKSIILSLNSIKRQNKSKTNRGEYSGI